MTEPIISPWIIYWFSVYDKFTIAFEYASAIICIAFLLFTWIFIASYVDESFKDELKLIVRKRYKKFTLLTVFMLTLGMFLPSKEIVLSMIVAQNVTPQRVEQTLELTDEAINYVGDKGEKAIERTTEILTDNVIKVIKAAQAKE